jgi:hypothetical protein
VKTQPANVDTVVIDGRILKHKGELVAIDVEEVIRRAAESFTAALSALAVPINYTIRDLTSMLLTPGK